MTLPIENDKLLKYYIQLDNDGKVIHPFLLEEHITASQLFSLITKKKLDDFSFEKTEKKQERTIEAYNYEKNYQRYAKYLAVFYKDKTGNNPKKCYRNITEEKYNEMIKDKQKKVDEEERDAMNSKTEYNEIKVKESNLANKNVISLRSMYPLEFTDKYNKKYKIYDVATDFLKEFPEKNWYEFEKKKDEKITCECGKEIMKSGLKKHLLRPIHKKYIIKKL